MDLFSLSNIIITDTLEAVTVSQEVNRKGVNLSASWFRLF